MSYSLFTWVTMPLLTLTAAVGMYAGAFRNGLFHHVEANIHAQYPTGINPLQKLSATMIEFFIPILSHENISLHVLGIHFLGLLMSAWILILVESYRDGPRDLSKSLIGVFGLLMEFLGVGFITPLWCLVNLTSSYLPLATSVSATHVSAPVPLRDAKALPWSLLIGAGTPTLLMQISRLQASTTVTSKQFWIIGRLFHPLFTLVAHRVLRSSAHHGVADSSAERVQSAQKIRKLLNVAFWIGAVSHGAIMTAVGVINLFPERFDARVARAFTLHAIWPVNSLWESSPSQIDSAADGIAVFLFWDEAVTAVSILIWALIVNRVVMSKVRPGRTLQVLVKTLVSSVLLGPSAAAILLVQEKDEATLVQRRKLN